MDFHAVAARLSSVMAQSLVVRFCDWAALAQRFMVVGWTSMVMRSGSIGGEGSAGIWAVRSFSMAARKAACMRADRFLPSGARQSRTE